MRVTEDEEKRKTLKGYKRKATRKGVVDCKAVATPTKYFSAVLSIHCLEFDNGL